jgi:hypothetical protein
MANKVIFDDKLKTAEYWLGSSLPIKIELNRVLAIGEFTTSGGPFSDDYCLYLIAPPIWYAIPMDSNGMMDFVKFLEIEFDTEIRTTLANSVTEKSRIIYPARLKDKEFLATELYKPKDWLDRLKVRFGIKPDRILKLHSDMNEILKTGLKDDVKKI